ncbi:RmlC-like cupin domain-containing protein [Mycena vulgaris]|nr:RmlC-like cupin domain-containing protein [Mycena vulgaris]
MLSLSTAFVLSAIVSSGFCASVPEQVGQLRLAPTAVDRIKALATDDQFVFDFFNPLSGVTTGQAGHTVAASSSNFPAVVGNGIAMTVGFLGPCGMNTPHTHPRATEINFSVNGTLRTGMLAENGARFVVNELPPGSMTVFPQGAIHFEVNEGCQPAMFVAGFNNEDPGVLSIAQRFFGLPPDIVGVTMGNLGVEQVKGLEAMIPDNVAAGLQACLQKCGRARPPAQPTAQHQPRVSGNAFPTGAAANPVSAIPSANSTASPSTTEPPPAASSTASNSTTASSSNV